MNPADVVLIRLPPAGGGAPKLRPALVLAALPGPYQNLLLCGISTQLHQLQDDWDELVEPGNTDFEQSGLHRASAVRLSFLHAVGPRQVIGVIGRIAPDRLDRLRTRLIDCLLGRRGA